MRADDERARRTVTAGIGGACELASAAAVPYSMEAGR